MQFALLLILLLSLTACAKLSHLPQLLTLKSMSENKDAQKKYVKKENESFEKVLAAFNSDTLSQYPDQAAVLKEFGKPLAQKKVVKDGQEVEKWVYRYSVRSFTPEKVQLFFNEKQELVSWEHKLPVKKSETEEAKHGPIQPETPAEVGP